MISRGSDQLRNIKVRIEDLQRQGISRKTAFLITTIEAKKQGLFMPWRTYESYKRHVKYCKTGK